MRDRDSSICFGVKLLTLAALTVLAGCSFLDRHFGESCKTHAYIRTILADYLSSRFSSGAQVRLAVVPFSVPANLAAASNENPGLGNTLAWKVQANMLRDGSVPIAEVFNRQDWPGKKEEFFTGNFGAIAFAREAGYDLVLVGYVESTTAIDTLTVHTKVIETASGTTLWYGKSVATTKQKRSERTLAALWMSDKRPDLLHLDELIDEAGQCIAREINSEQIS